MTDYVLLRHTIPQIGVEELPLYPPADFVYQRLRAHNEVNRLNKLRHLGALSRAFPGARQARWDYTLAMLHYSHQLRVPGMNSAFTIGKVHFSSAISALQVLSLLWNVGHLPGTFSAEKGVYRFLHGIGPNDPASHLEWPMDALPSVAELRVQSNRFLLSNDYLGLSRVLAIIKLLSLSGSDNDDLFNLLRDFVAPFFLGSTAPRSAQWPKLRMAFDLVRHLAYLTLDAPFTGQRWSLPIPDLLQYLLSSTSPNLDQLHATIVEVLSPIERNTFESLYHSPEARQECAVVPNRVLARLSAIQNPAAEITRWMRVGLFNELKLGHASKARVPARIGTIRLRSHFVSPSKKPVALEAELNSMGYVHPLALEYPAWNTDILLEPDEQIIDVLSDRAAPDQIGRLILWIISHLDDLDPDLDNPLPVWRKNELEAAYASLLDSAIARRLPEMRLRLQPWPISEYGLLPGVTIPQNKGCLWAANARLDDNLTRHILRDHSSTIPQSLRLLYAELMGIRALRASLRRTWGKKVPRQRWLIVAGSARFCVASRTAIEFDGALVRISARSGRITWYGLESKKGDSSPLHSLRRRLRALSIDVNLRELSSHYAVAEIGL